MGGGSTQNRLQLRTQRCLQVKEQMKKFGVLDMKCRTMKWACLAITSFGNLIELPMLQM